MRKRVPRPGFEPRLTGPEPVVLPLNDLGITVGIILWFSTLTECERAYTRYWVWCQHFFLKKIIPFANHEECGKKGTLYMEENA